MGVATPLVAAQLTPTEALRQSPPLRLGITLGLRPKGAQRSFLPHAFALLRSLTIDALVTKYWGLMSLSAARAPQPVLLPLEIAAVFASVKAAFSDALKYERTRAEKDNQVLQAAGRDLGPDNDAVLRFRKLWVDTGLCGGGGQQLLL